MSEAVAPQPKITAIKRPSTRQDQKQQTKTRLLEAAIELFHNTGYQQTTIDQIVRKAGTSRPTFYAHFRDKIDLANHIGANLAPLMVPIYELIDRPAQPTVADVRHWLDAMIDFRRLHRASIEAATDATASDPKIIHTYVETLVRNTDLYMPNYLVRFQGQQREDARARLILLILQIERFLFITEIRGAAFPLPGILDITAELWWSTLFRDLPPTS